MKRLVTLAAFALSLSPSATFAQALPTFHCSMTLTQPLPATGHELSIAPESAVVEFDVTINPTVDQHYGAFIEQVVNDKDFPQYSLKLAETPNHPTIGGSFSSLDQDGNPLPLGTYGVTLSSDTLTSWKLISHRSFAIDRSVAIPGLTTRGQVIMICLAR